MKGLRDRVSYVQGPGGSIAFLYWLCRHLFRIEIYGVFARSLSFAEARPPAGFRLIELIDPQQLGSIPSSLLEEIDDASGYGAKSLIERGHRLYVLMADSQVACQLNIEMNEGSTDVPAALKLQLKPKSAFLGFLYTYEPFRRQHLAEHLIQLVSDRLFREGLVECVCHVSMTNVPSVAAFRKAQWKRVGFLIASRGGRLIAAPGCYAAGIAVQSRG